MFAAANRDPRFWDAPDDYRLDRDTKHSLGWGYGVHGCVGRTLAQMEASALLGAIVAEVESIELAGPYEPWMTTVGHGPIRQPVKLNSLELTMAAPVIRIDAIQYARHERSRRYNFAHPVDDHDLPMPLDYFVWAIHRDGEPPLIVDTGFGEMPRRPPGQHDHPPGLDGLRAAGIDHLWSRT